MSLKFNPGTVLECYCILLGLDKTKTELTKNVNMISKTLYEPVCAFDFDLDTLWNHFLSYSAPKANILKNVYWRSWYCELWVFNFVKNIYLQKRFAFSKV